MFEKKIVLTALGSLSLVAGSANAAVVWSDDFSYGTGTAADEAAMDANGWDTPGTFGSDYGITAGQRLWGNGGVAMPLLRVSTGHFLADGDSIDINVDVERTGGYDYFVEIFAWDGTTATSLGSGTVTTSTGTVSATATAAHAGQELVFDYQHSVNWGETNSIEADVTPIPEPGSLALLALGGLMIARRRRG